MDRAVQTEPQPQLPMTAEPQHGSLAQGSSGAPKHGRSSQDYNTGNANGPKRLRRFFGFLQQGPDNPGSNTPAEQRNSNNGEPKYEDVPLGPMTGVSHADQAEPPKPALTGQTSQDNQQGQNSTQGPQRQVRRVGSLSQGRVGATQAGPDGSENGEFTFRGGDTGNCIQEPCSCCAYWINKICCGGED
ncbi:hypothetical protein F5Y00DRAFT_271635 [Daldinia vernicosa]|uniref:uncharacterized protein n=1 Tax=Daldinia vernicosa TaxID=114800 RepID=UPI002007A699|nr:uncharacterized protein F5Y00DRAFT_271635 [Daldinia vernicosa]KAI0853170.1 hypothetical protein F5Y00DRAFT_271635 [Daldinia vernicosa]